MEVWVTGVIWDRECTETVDDQRLTKKLDWIDDRRIECQVGEDDSQLRSKLFKYVVGYFSTVGGLAS
jgi:hypothetical protein